MRPPQRQFLWTAALVAFLAISFNPAIRIAAWHLRHGNTLNWEGASLNVPWGWYTRLDGRHATITKLSLTVFSKNSAPAAADFSPVAVPPKSDAERESAYQAFPSVYWNYLVADRDQMSGPIQRGSGEGRATCMETIHKDAEKGITVYCLAHGGTLYATFVGDPKELDTFYKILDEVR